MSKVSNYVLRIASTLEGQVTMLIELPMKNGNRIALATGAVIAVIERSETKTRIVTAGAGAHNVELGYDAVFAAPEREFEPEG